MLRVPRRSAGFTLIELLLVMVLLGLTASVAMVSVNRLVSRWQEQSVANDVYSALKMARIWALSGGSSVRVDFSAETLAVHQGSTLKRLVKLPKSVHLEGQVGSAGGLGSIKPIDAAVVFLFWPDGGLEGGTLRLVAGERVIRQYTLHEATGRIRSSS